MKLSELLRPKDLSDLVQPRHIVDRLEHMAEEGRLLSMIFYGKPGMGKTSAARILIDRVHADDYKMNGSVDVGIDTLRDGFSRWASSCSLTGDPKVCLVDECDNLSRRAQVGLRGLIDEFPHIAFLMTANNLPKVDPALRSRCIALKFDLAPVDYADAITRLYRRCDRLLRKEGYRLDPGRLHEIICLHFPDMRTIANELEFDLQADDGAPVALS